MRKHIRTAKQALRRAILEKSTPVRGIRATGNQTERSDAERMIDRLARTAPMPAAVTPIVDQGVIARDMEALGAVVVRRHRCAAPPACEARAAIAAAPYRRHQRRGPIRTRLD